ncbi:MAG: hypothetical protein ACQEXJ_05265 [Myxococcota bacterium]
MKAATMKEAMFGAAADGQPDPVADHRIASQKKAHASLAHSVESVQGAPSALSD